MTNADNQPRSARRTPLPVSRALRDTAEHVTVWRKLRGLTQSQVADRADVSLGTVRRLEAGQGAVSLENSLRIFRALGILEGVPASIDPHNSDVGRLRSEEHLPQRVRPRKLSERHDG